MDPIFHICHIFITFWWCIYSFQNSFRYVSGQEGWAWILRISVHSEDGHSTSQIIHLHILTNKSNGSFLNREQGWTLAWIEACRQKYKAKLTSFLMVGWLLVIQVLYLSLSPLSCIKLSYCGQSILLCVWIQENTNVNILHACPNWLQYWVSFKY